ncbi:hypothetical protein AB0I60_04875 [Actinosynnema sp. NPDC050436]|uniref:hypothetical protein n=1 Tax=Actinosynnema sp. NPDC050436 TaxID=3155659 RepID=UPI0033EBA351
MNGQYAVVAMPTRRRPPAVPLPVAARTVDASALYVDHSEPTRYLPSPGDLPQRGLLPSSPDIGQERAALQGQRCDDGHLALLDRVLEALRRI